MGLFDFLHGGKQQKSDADIYMEQRRKERSSKEAEQIECNNTLDKFYPNTVNSSYTVFNNTYHNVDSLFVINDVFLIPSVGTIVSGKILSGTFTIGDLVHIQSSDGIIESKITAMVIGESKIQHASASSEDVSIALPKTLFKSLHVGDKIMNHRG